MRKSSKQSEGRPTATALGVNKHRCMVAVKVVNGRIVYCRRWASVRLDWIGLPPLYQCMECYEAGRKRDKDIPKLEDLRKALKNP